MSTRPETIVYLLDMLSDLPLTHRKMFGEYAIYLNGLVVALVCDDQLWVKPMPGARAALPDCPQGHPFLGSRLYLDVTEALDDPAPIVVALQAVARERPPMTPRKSKKASRNDGPNR